MKPKIIILLFLLARAGLAATAAPYGLAADNRIHAQRLVNEILATTPERLTAGMHCVPPGGAAQTIIASTLNVIGKPSDPPDVEVGTHGATLMALNLKVPKLGIMLPLRDRAGRDIGALALAFKYRAGEDQVKYFVAATTIRDRLAQQILSQADLFSLVP